MPDGAYLTAEGEFIWVPSHEDGGLHEFTVRVTDSGDTANWSETTSRIEVNARPELELDFGDEAHLPPAH